MENGHEPATKQDLAAVKQDIIAEVKQDIAMVRSEMQHTHDSLIERMAGSETKLLKAFYTFADSNQVRLAEVESESAALRKRLGVVESRVTDLEKRLNMPPEQTQ